MRGNAREATDPTMEQGLEAPAPGSRRGLLMWGATDVGWETVFTVHGAKGEGARRAVKVASSDGRSRDASPRFRREPGRRCRRRESFEGQERAVRIPFRDGRNTANPRIGSRAQQTCTVGEEQAAEVVRNHEGGTRERPAVALRRGRGDADPGAGLFDVRRWRGDLWTNPGEEVQPRGWAAWIGTRRESRRQGQEGRVRTHSRVAHPGRRDLEGPRARREVVRGRSRRGAVEPDTAESAGGSPPVDGPRWEERTARTRPLRASAAPSECAWRCHTRWPRGEGSFERAERRVRPWRPDEPHTRPPGRTGCRFGGGRGTGLTARCVNL
jgi:hypothetical protein